MLLTEGQACGHKGARLVLEALPPAKVLIADKGYDSIRFRKVFEAKGIRICPPASRSRKRLCPYERGLCRQRHKVENLLAQLND